MSRFFPLDKGPRNLKTEDLLKLNTVAEGWYCEYKREMVKVPAIAKSISAFANTYGGWVFYGIAEDKDTRCAASAPGIPAALISQAEMQLRQAVSSSLNPAPYYEHVILHGPLPEVGLTQDRAVVAVFIPRGVDAPYLHASGRIYRRVADESDPREETDRYFVDSLYNRSRLQKKRIKKAISRPLERSKAEKNAPCLRLLIFTDLWDELDTSELSFAKFKALMNSGELAFDNCYTSTYGHVARLTQGNDPSRMIFSWHHRGWFEEIILPFSWFLVPQNGLPYPLFSEFNNATEFMASCRASRLVSRPAMELSGMFLTIFNLCKKIEALIDELKVNPRLFVKVQISGIWRAIPFVDVPRYSDFISQNGLPVAQEDIVYGPPGLGEDNLSELNAWRRSDFNASALEESRSSAEVMNTILIYKEICRCLGLPPEALGLEPTTDEEVKEVFDALLDASFRSYRISRRHIGLE